LIFKYFGECENYTIINNGADIEYVKSVKPLKDRKLDRYENIWTCASHWRGWKRMPDNIRYFLEFSGEKDCLLVAGMPLQGEVIEHERIFYTGHLSPPTLFSIFKISKNFIHLARYDACPNVVVDARAAGCHIICSSEGGTKEVAGEGATVVVEEPWDMNPIDVDNPPKLEFKNIIKNDIISDIDMTNVADKYINYLKTFMEKKK
jgi:glycosyltransferase involved in cell wall biosynthesis